MTKKRAAFGAAPDERKFLVAVEDLVEVLGNVVKTWADSGNNDAYPKYLPSFDEFQHDMLKWQQKVQEKARNSLR